MKLHTTEEVFPAIRRISEDATTTREDVLDMINCAQDYGLGHSIFYAFLFDMLGRSVSPEEIEEYVQTFSEEEGYEEEDAEAARAVITELVKVYCAPRTNRVELRIR